jgi:hypothetical protein
MRIQPNKHRQSQIGSLAYHLPRFLPLASSMLSPRAFQPTLPLLFYLQKTSSKIAYRFIKLMTGCKPL